MIAPRRALAWVVVATTATLLGGFALKEQCSLHEWSDYYQYRHYCYSDTLPMWGIRGFDEDRIPYVEEFNEYPVLTGFFAYAAALLSDDLGTFLLLNFFWLLVAGAFATQALWLSGVTYPRILLWSASPALLVHALTNWDLLAVAFGAWGWLRWREHRHFQSALFFGLGASAKFYPIFFLPFLLLAAVLARNRRQTVEVVGGGFLGLGVPNLIVAVWHFEGWWATWRFHGNRDPDFETPWVFLQDVGPDWLTQDHRLRTVSAVVTVTALAIGLAVLAWRQWKHDLDPLVAGGLLSLVFLLVNKVYSPQYTLWTMPLLILLGVRWAPYAGFVAADVANFLIRYRLFTPPAGLRQGWNEAWEPWSRLAVAIRWGFLAWAFVSLWLGSRTARREPEAAAAAPAPDSPDVVGSDPGRARPPSAARARPTES